jgi:hypothetical protein
VPTALRRWKSTAGRPGRAPPSAGSHRSRIGLFGRRGKPALRLPLLSEVEARVPVSRTARNIDALEYMSCTNLSKEIRYFLDLKSQRSSTCLCHPYFHFIGFVAIGAVRANKNIMLRVANNGRDDDRRGRQGKGSRTSCTLY